MSTPTVDCSSLQKTVFYRLVKNKDMDAQPLYDAIRLFVALSLLPSFVIFIGRTLVCANI